MYYREPGEKGRKYYAYVERSGHYAISQEHRDRVCYRRVPRDYDVEGTATEHDADGPAHPRGRLER